MYMSEEELEMLELQNKLKDCLALDLPSVSLHAVRGVRPVLRVATGCWSGSILG